MGLMSRNKGKRFERKIATALREWWPDVVVRRASQADRAYQSDVYITGGPALLERLWIEAQDARNPTPMAKLEQAEFDCAVLLAAESQRLPIAVTHKTAMRSIQVTMRMSTFDAIRGLGPLHDNERDNVPLTLDFRVFLDLVARYATKVASP